MQAVPSMPIYLNPESTALTERYSVSRIHSLSCPVLLHRSTAFSALASIQFCSQISALKRDNARSRRVSRARIG
jgi:hypothetical protein